MIMNGRALWLTPITRKFLCIWPLSSNAEIHEVIVQNFNFSQSDLTIVAGDTVRRTKVWGFHNVMEDQFSRSSETGFGWVYEPKFNQTAVVLYHRTMHSGLGQSKQASMNGRITITAPIEPVLFADGFESVPSTTVQGAKQ